MSPVLSTRPGEDASINSYWTEPGYRCRFQNQLSVARSEHWPVLMNVGQVEEEQDAVLSLASSFLHILAIRQESKAFRAPAAYLGQPMLQELRHCREFWGGNRPEKITQRTGEQVMVTCESVHTDYCTGQGHTQDKRQSVSSPSLGLPGETEGNM